MDQKKGSTTKPKPTIKRGKKTHIHHTTNSQNTPNMAPNSSKPLLIIPEVSLSPGSRKIPAFGLGTAADPPVAAEITKKAVLDAIELGYRHFDSAALYFNEEPLGEAIAEALDRGLIKSREELFITSKLWCSEAHGHLVLPAISRTLKNLKLEYVDLYLIHWPVSAKPVGLEYPIKKEDFLPMDFKTVWASMEECQKLGLTKAIGVCNFSIKKLQHLLENATIPPSVNQVEINPVWQQKKLRDFCKEKGILVVAYAALGAFGTFYGTNRVMESEVLKEIAEGRGKTVPQVCLRWAIEQGIGVLAKSFNKERMKQNLEIFNWELTKEDAKKISEIPQSRACLGIDYTSPYGPFKTTEELWDGEYQEANF